MHKYDKGLSYIDYFSTSGKEIGTCMHNSPDFPYLNYSQEMSSFIHEVYHTDIMDTEYLPFLLSHIHKESYLNWSRFT